MHDAQVYHNRASTTNNGGVPGILVSGPNAKFVMHGGRIDCNSGNVRGGGVDVNEGTFILNGGYIEGNEAAGPGNETGMGGQVYVKSDSFFYMYGGTLSGKGSNAEAQVELGAGVYIAPGGTFTKTGGNNLRASDGGDAVYYLFYDSNDSSEHIRTRNTTLGPKDNISTDNLNENWDS